MVSKFTALFAGAFALFVVVSASADQIPSDPVTIPYDSSRNTEVEDEWISQAARPGDEWRYDTYYLLPLTRHMPDSELPLAGQIALYPFAAVIDLAQLPFGALAGLIGE